MGFAAAQEAGQGGGGPCRGCCLYNRGASSRGLKIPFWHLFYIFENSTVKFSMTRMCHHASRVRATLPSAHHLLMWLSRGRGNAPRQVGLDSSSLFVRGGGELQRRAVFCQHFHHYDPHAQQEQARGGGSAGRTAQCIDGRPTAHLGRHSGGRPLRTRQRQAWRGQAPSRAYPSDPAPPAVPHCLQLPPSHSN